MATFFFCGIGGTGMSAIALFLHKNGHNVYGSDRSFDNNQNELIKNNLINQGIMLFSQDGSGVNDQVDYLVVSTAIEESIPDVKKAKELNIPIRKRAEVLAKIFHKHESGIAIGGTSGKTTVTAMTGHILYTIGKPALMINGGISLNKYDDNDNSNLLYAKSETCVIEADESDGSIELYNPFVSVVTNISLDHKPLEEIRPLFERFLARAKNGIVINKNCEETKKIKLPETKIISFSVEKDKTATLYANNIRCDSYGTSFDLNGVSYKLPIIGKHNLENALAAASACFLVGVSVEESMKALTSFKGTKRRLESVGRKNEIQIIDDYAHNVEKIKATLLALKNNTAHLYAIYQPHGFAPLKLMRDELINMLEKELTDNIDWLMLPVYYAGGTVNRTISSDEIVVALKASKKNAHAFESRKDLSEYLIPKLKPEDTVVVMGARDDSLSEYAKTILNEIK